MLTALQEHFTKISSKIRKLLREREQSVSTAVSTGCQTVADPTILKGGERKTIYQFCRHLSQMRTTKYMPFTRKIAVSWKTI